MPKLTKSSPIANATLITLLISLKLQQTHAFLKRFDLCLCISPFSPLCLEDIRLRILDEAVITQLFFYAYQEALKIFKFLSHIGFLLVLVQ